MAPENGTVLSAACQTPAARVPFHADSEPYVHYRELYTGPQSRLYSVRLYSGRIANWLVVVSIVVLVSGCLEDE